MTAASTLVSDDPYTTAVMLLKVGAYLTTEQAGEAVSGHSYDEVRAFAAQADTDETAAELVARLVHTAVADLSRLGIGNIVHKVFSVDPGRWTR